VTHDAIETYLVVANIAPSTPVGIVTQAVSGGRDSTGKAKIRE
jgi:hypothetical protein